MKNIKKVIAMLLILTTLTGCIKSKTEMTINKDKSMVFETSYLISDKMLEYSQQTTDDVFTQEQLDYLKKRNLTYEKKSDNGYTGYVLKKVYDNIDNISNETGKEIELSDYLNEGFDDSVFFKVEKGFLKNKYTASFKYNLEYNDFNDLSYSTQSNNNELAMGTGIGETTTPNTTIDNNTTPNNGTLTTPGDGTNDNTTIIGDDTTPSTNEPDYGELTKLASEMEISYTVNLPEKAISNNATESQNDGKKLVWKLTTDSENKIEYVFEVKNMTNYYILYGGIAAGVIIVVLIIIMIIKKGKKGKEVIPAQDKPIHADYDPSIAAAIPNPAIINGTLNQTVNNEIANTVQAPTASPEQIEQPVNGPIGNSNTESQAYIIPEVTVEPQMAKPEVKPMFITPENMPEETLNIQEIKPEVKIETPQNTNINQN